MPENNQTMNNPVIVQFFHSGREFPVKLRRSQESVEISWVPETAETGCVAESAGCADETGGCASQKPKRQGTVCGEEGKNKGQTKHTRRLVVHEGDFVDELGKMQTAELAFWTEWEACSTAAAMSRPTNDDTAARWFHRVKSPLGIKGQNRKNTDPCVFGRSFKYCCCQQHSRNERNESELMNLAPGSIILFGARLNRKFVLDTVFVVDGDNIRRYINKTKGELDVSDEYRELALNRFSNPARENTFYRGVTYRSVDGSGAFSFVPSKKFDLENPDCGKRFFPDLADLNNCLRNCPEQFNPDTMQTQGIHVIHATQSIVANVWNEIVRQVLDDGFFPGVHFDWPK